MAQDNQHVKFERNEYNRFRDNRCQRLTDGQTMDVGRRVNFDFMSSADKVKQS